MENTNVYDFRVAISPDGNTHVVFTAHIEVLFDKYGVDKIPIILQDLNYEYSKCMWRVSTCDVGGWDVFDFSEGSPIKIHYDTDTLLPTWMCHKIAVLDMLPIGSDLVDGVGYRPTYGLYWLEREDGDTRSESKEENCR